MVLKFAMQEPELEPLIHNEMLACPRAVPERRLKPHPNQLLKCPRCDSSNTKFCYYNNYSLTQPRHFCKACRRYWTKGGALRNVPVGGGCRKNKRSKQKTADQQGAGASSSKPSTITVPSTLSGENSFSSGHGSPSTPLSQSQLRNSSAAAYLTYSVDEDDGGRYALDATGKMQHISRLEETDLSGNQTMLSPELGSNLAILTGGDTSNLYSFLSGMLSADALPSLDGGVVGLNNYPSYGVSAKGDTGLLSSCDAVQTLGAMAHEINGSCSTSDGSGNGAYMNRASYDLPWNLYHQHKLGAQFNGVQSTDGQHLRRVGEDRATENLGVVKDEFSSNITGHSLFAEGSSGAHRPLDWQLPSDGYFETAGDLCVLPGGNWPDLTLYGSGSGTLS